MDIADKVRKLLNLSARAGTEGEAKAAAAQAARIIAEHGLSEDALGDAGEDDNRIDGADPRTIFRREGSSSLLRWEGSLSGALAALCGCFAWRRYVRGSYVEVVAVGRQRDLDTFAALYPAIRGTIATLVRKKSCEPRTRPFSPSEYGYGVVVAIIERMHHEQNAVLEEIRRTAKCALVPTDWAAMAEKAAQAGRTMKPARKHRIRSPGSAHAGYTDGAAVAVPGEHRAIAGQLALGLGGGDE